MISAVALLVSLASLVGTVRALDQANYARTLAHTAQSGQISASAPPPATRPGDTAGPDPSAPATTNPAPPIEPPSTAAPSLNPETRYNIKYEKEILDLQWPGGCASEAYVDLDEPRVIVRQSPGADLKLSRCGNAPTPYFKLQGDSQAALLSSAGATPQECAERIQKGPVLPESEIPARQGQIFCLLTGFAAAQQTGDTRKMVRAEITSVATNERISIEVTAWIIP
ncbi:hypothetical protein [Catenuloplanes japonicus]|uniref:hypothetical protein n=1 Tax=Catenuloplanes japonicus TaxID=33876 RepID=UPI0012FBCFEB|nr:hypothetical protein [Catenuloplanes japonicus]